MPAATICNGAHIESSEVSASMMMQMVPTINKPTPMQATGMVATDMLCWASSMACSSSSLLSWEGDF